MKNKDGTLNGMGYTVATIISALFVIAIIAGFMYGIPRYSVWSLGLA